MPRSERSRRARTFACAREPKLRADLPTVDAWLNQKQRELDFEVGSYRGTSRFDGTAVRFGQRSYNDRRVNPEMRHLGSFALCRFATDDFVTRAVSVAKCDGDNVGSTIFSGVRQRDARASRRRDAARRSGLGQRR